MTIIEWDKAKLRELKRCHAKAVKDGKDSFTIGGNEFLVSYAKYLIEYLEGRFG
jgi:hypothetical protein